MPACFAFLHNAEPEWSDLVLEEIEELGRGPRGVVHLVRDTQSQRVMARKTIATSQPEERMREADMLRALRHPNIVEHFGAYVVPARAEIKVLAEFCAYGSLRAVSQTLRARGATLPEPVARHLTHGMLRGLAHLHAKEMVHGHVNPSNVLLTREGTAKLADFGLSGQPTNRHCDITDEDLHYTRYAAVSSPPPLRYRC
jgi:mitogen-activated protein kinase kinase